MATNFDIERARRETRGCEEVLHFNNAGASLPPAPVIDALIDYLRDEEMNGGYEVMARRTDELEHFYVATGRLLNCRPNEIAFTDSATRAWNAALYAFAFRPGDRILLGSSEYGSNLVALLHRARACGVELLQVPDDGDGQIDLHALEAMIDERVRLICLTMIPSGEGLINPASAVGKITSNAGIPFLLDACQAMGQLPVDVEEIRCDILCGTGRKYLRGPRGSGLLYVRNSFLERLEPSQLNHHAAELLSTQSYKLRPDARRFECWERSYAAQYALGVAIDYALDWELEAIAERCGALAADLRSRLAEIDGIVVTDRGLAQSAIVTFYAAQVESERLKRQLEERKINLSTVNFSANPVSSARRDMPPLLRASLHYYNTENELDQFIDTLKVLLGS